MSKRNNSAVTVLTAEEFSHAHTHFLDCLNKEMAKRDAQAVHEIEKWIAEVVLMTPVYSLRADALQKFIDNTYLLEDVRDFVFDLGFRFFSSWGIPHGAARLSASLVEGLSQDGQNPEMSLIPKEILASMSVASTKELIDPPTWWDRLLGRQPQSLQGVLTSNKPLLVMYLIYVTHTNTPAA